MTTAGYNGKVLTMPTRYVQCYQLWTCNGCM